MIVTSDLPSKILVIDEDPSVAVSLEKQLKPHRIIVVKATDADSAQYLFNTNKFDVVMVEMDFNGLPGWTLIQKWRRHQFLEKRCTGFIVMAEDKDADLKHTLPKECIDVEFSIKPINEPELLPLLSKAMATKARLVANSSRYLKVVSESVKSGKVVSSTDGASAPAPALTAAAKADRQQIQFYEKYGRWRECLDVTVKLLEQSPNDVDLLNQACRMNLKLGEFEGAKNFLEKVDKIAPNNPDHVRGLATIYLKTNEPRKSLERFKELVHLSPKSPDVKFEALQSIADAGFEALAMKFGQETAQPAEVLRYYNNKGVLLSKVGKVEEALLEYGRAIKIFPDHKQNYLIYFNMALAHLKRRNPDDIKKAKDYLHETLRLEPRFDKAKWTLETLGKRGAVTSSEAG